MEMNALNPSWIDTLQSRIAVQSAPLWLMKPIVPGNASGFANVAHLAAPFENLLFEFRPGRSAFLESRRDNDRPFHARCRTFGNDFRNRGSRCRNDGKIHRFRRVTDR